MADDIQSSFKELVNNASNEKSDFKAFALLCLGMVVGLYIGYSMNLEKDAQIRATKDCGICQENLGIMIGNFNTMAKQCSNTIPLQRNISILPAIGMNQTVSVYAS